MRDRAERHDLKSRLLLFFSPFHFPPKKEGRRKGGRIAIVILSHAFLLDIYEDKGNDKTIFILYLLQLCAATRHYS